MKISYNNSFIKKIFFSIGLTFFLVSINFFFFTSAILFKGEAIDSNSTSISISRLYKRKVYDYSQLYYQQFYQSNETVSENVDILNEVEIKYNFRIKYLKKMQNNKSQHVELEIIKESTDKTGDISTVSHESDILLYSSVFNITPNNGKQKIKKNTSFPILFSWNISPKKTGLEQIIDLDLRKFIVNSPHYSLKNNAFFLNDEKTNVDASNVVKFKIDVVTVWGISEKTFKILRTLILFLGFILTYPLISDYLKSKISN